MCFGASAFSKKVSENLAFNDLFISLMTRVFSPCRTMVSFRMANGCVGFYEAGWGETLRSSNVKEFIGSEGRITLEMQAQRERDREEGDLITVYQRESNTYRTINLQAQYKDMYAQLKMLISMIETNSAGNPTIDDVWRSFIVAQYADKAITSGTMVRIPEKLQ